jgi:hypothetical protein
MLIVSNRELNAERSGFGAAFEPGSTQLSVAEASLSKDKQWTLKAVQANVGDAQLVTALRSRLQKQRPVLVYLHGNNKTPERCFERCARLEELYDYEVIGYSWPSEGLMADGNTQPRLPQGTGNSDAGDLDDVTRENRQDNPIKRKIARYRQAKRNAEDGTDALARFLRLLGDARQDASAQAFSLAVHSLGAHYLRHTLQLPGASPSLSAAHNIALLAPCESAAGHADWLAKLTPKGQVFVTYNKGDSVLLGAYIADGEQLKLGTDPGPDRLQGSKRVRYISFSRANVGPGGHGYFVMDNMPTNTQRLFQRIFGSLQDVQAGESEKKVYPLGCDTDGLTCYMARPEEDPSDGG